MKLNKINGHFSFGNHLIKPSYKIRDIKNEFLDDSIELWIANKSWITYRLEIAMKFILLIKFFNEDLKTIEIYLTYQSGKQMENELRNLLKSLGGENKYSWGNVELNKDIKAGYESIVINVNG